MSLELLAELFAHAPRQGPGERAATHRAFSWVEEFPPGARLLDVGCGTGAQTRDLAAVFGGFIVAADVFPAFVARAHGGRVRGVCASMTHLPFASGAFDVVWSEGAVYIMGFAEGLRAWRRLLKPGGWVVVSELSWFSTDPPEEARTFWQANYPGMQSVHANCAAARAAGYAVAATFPLPGAAWWTAIYDSLTEALPVFREKYAGNSEAMAVADETEQEIRLFRRHSDAYGYQFFVLRKT